MFKKQTVFILGAGASVGYDYPTGHELLRTLINDTSFHDYSNDFCDTTLKIYDKFPGFGILENLDCHIFTPSPDNEKLFTYAYADCFGKKTTDDLSIELIKGIDLQEFILNITKQEDNKNFQRKSSYKSFDLKKMRASVKCS